jgi:hypothetical protein
VGGDVLEGHEGQNCTICGQILTRYRWKKKIKKEIKTVMRWTSKVMYSVKCANVKCDKYDVPVPDRKSSRKFGTQNKHGFPESDNQTFNSASKGGGTFSKVGRNIFPGKFSSFQGGGQSETEEISHAR